MKGLRIAMVFVAVLAPAVLVLAPAANAHTGLVSSDPADGSVLQQAPQAVTLTFDEDLLPGASTLSINSSDGTVLKSTPVEPNGPSVSLPWPSGLGAGDYQVAYRVVSGDGHPVTGAISFTVAAAPDDAAASSTNASPSIDASPSTEASPTTPTVQDDAETPAEPAPAPPIALALAGVALAGIAAVVVAMVLARRRGN